MLEVIDLMACLRSSVGISYLLTISIIVSMVFQIMHATIGIRVYQFRSQQMVSELMMFVQGLSALDEIEDVVSMEFSGGIKMKKITRKFRFVLKKSSMTFVVY